MNLLISIYYEFYRQNESLESLLRVFFINKKTKNSLLAPNFMVKLDYLFISFAKVFN